MVTAKRGRPQKQGERYPGGKLKPAQKQSGSTDRQPISPALWQRIKADGIKLGADPRLTTELGRLALHDELSNAEVSAGFRIAEIYLRFERFHQRSRSAGGSSFFNAFVANDERPIEIGRRQHDEYLDIDREEAEREAKAEFELLQFYMPPSHRAFVEQLCVENRPVNPHVLRGVRITLRYFSELFKDDKKYRAKMAEKLGRNAYKHKIPSKKKKPTAPAEVAPVEIKKAPENKDKSAWFQVQRILRPDLTDQQLEEAWAIFIALKARSAFRQAKSENHMP